MPNSSWPKNILENLQVTRVDLVKEGADSTAHIRLFKNKGGLKMNYEEILKGLQPDAKAAIEAEVVKAKEDGMKMSEEDKKKAKEYDQMKKAKEDAEQALADSQVSKGKDESDEEAVLKALPAAALAIIEKSRKQAAAAEKIAKSLQEAKVTEEAVTKSKELQCLGCDSDTMVNVLKSLNSVDKELADNVMGIFKTANTVIEKGGLFKPAGVNGGDSNGNAWDAFEAEASSIAKSKNITFEQATVEIMKSKPELYQAYLDEEK